MIVEEEPRAQEATRAARGRPSAHGVRDGVPRGPGVSGVLSVPQAQELIKALLVLSLRLF